MEQQEKVELKGKVFDPRGLVDYQPGAVVSRTLLDTKAALSPFKMVLTMIRGSH